MRILITGSRDWTDWHTIEVAIREQALKAFPDRATVVHGDCPTGADMIADVLAQRMGLTIEKHPADWDAFGKFAGPKRNKEMVDLGADVCLAFPLGASRGTRGCMKFAREAGILVRDYDPALLT